MSTGPGPTAPPLLPAIAVIAVGGALGSLLRYELGRAIGAHGFPVATLVINLIGALLLGVLIAAVTEVWSAHPLLRPALGTGVLGGFTTFSTFALEVRGADAAVATAYLAASLLGGVFAAAAGRWLVTGASGTRARRTPAPPGAAPVGLDPDLP